MPLNAVFLGLLVALCAVTADRDNNFWPLDKELTYEYTAHVQSGTVHPAHFVSEYTIEGKLHVQARGNDAVFKFSEVKCSLYNGRKDDAINSKSNFLPLPEDASEISSPFRIHYKEGKVKKLYIQETDALWAQNMKKAVASIMQLDLTKSMSIDEPNTFSGEEDSIYGTCNVSYGFSPEAGGDKKFGFLIKTIDMSTCKGSPLQPWSNSEERKCNSQNAEEPMPIVIQRKYYIKKRTPTTENLPCYSINSQSGISFLPFRGLSDIHYTTVNQTFKLIKMGDIVEQINVENEMEIQELKYILPRPSPLGIAADHSLGRNKYDSDLMAKTILLLDEILGYMEENHVDGIEPNWNRTALISRIMYEAMDYMGVELLNNCYTELSKNSAPRDLAKRDLFLRLLPLVGTDASAITVRNLVRKSKVKSPVAENMLHAVPVNIRYPSEKLLEEMENLIHLPEEHPQGVRHAAILSFASLVYKTCKDNTDAEFRNRTVDRIAELYARKLIDAEGDYATRMVYLFGLFNMRVGKAGEVLKTIVEELPHSNRHLQHLALWASSPVGMTDFNTAYALYWPSLENSQAHLQCRTAALQLLMFSATSISHFMRLHWIMTKERQNIHLYSMYYSTLKSIATVTFPCLRHKSQFAAKILRITRPPTVSTLTGSTLTDYSDEKFGFGTLLKRSIVADPDSGIPYILQTGFSSHMMDYKSDPLSILLKVEGLEELFELLPHNDIHPSADPARVAANVLDQARYLISNTSNDRPNATLHVEVIVIMYGQAISTLYFNETTFKNLQTSAGKEKLQALLAGVQSFNFQRINIAGMEVHIPTDLGVPAVLEFESPVVISLSGKLNLEKYEHYESILRFWSHKYHSLSVMNPVTGGWHGVLKAGQHTSQLPISVNLAPQKGTTKITLGYPEGFKDLNATIGIQFFGKTITFVYDDPSIDEKTYLEQSCPTCHYAAEAIRDPSRLKQVVLAQTHWSYLGLISQTKIFNCDRDFTISGIKRNIARDWEDVKINDNGSHWNKLLLTWMRFDFYNSWSPRPGQCGLLMRLAPDPEMPSANHVEIILDPYVEEESTTPAHNLLRGFNFIFDAQVALKDSNDQILRKIELSTRFTSSPGLTNNSFNAQLTTHVGGKPNTKVCVEYTKTFPQRGHDVLALGWGDEKVHSHLHLSAGDIVDGNVDECPTNGSSLTIETVGEMSDEQKQLASADVYPFKQCALDKTKSEWQGSLTPRSWACVQSIIKLTTLRKYTSTITYNKIPPIVLDAAYSITERNKELIPHYMSAVGGPFSGEEYSTPNTAHLLMEYALDEPIVDITLKTPTIHSRYDEVPMSSSPGAQFYMLDNTHFSWYYLWILNSGISKACIINLEALYTADNATVAHPVGSEYELYAGYSTNLNRFSAYIKKVEAAKPLVLKLINKGITLEISNDGVTLDGNPVTGLENGFKYPEHESVGLYSVWKNGDQIQVLCRNLGVLVEYTGHSVIIEQPSYHLGIAMGLCGNLNRDQLDDVPST